MTLQETAPPDRTVDGWHWLKHPDGDKPFALEWVSACQKYWFHTDLYSPEQMTERGWRYIAPCPYPDEVKDE